MIAEVIMCSWLIGGHSISTDKEIAQKTCELVLLRAVEANQDPALMVALAYHESRLNPKALSRSNARGPLQVIPAQCKRWLRAGSPFVRANSIYWKKCDLIAAGVWTWSRWRKKSPDERTAVCRYNAGYRCEKGSRSWKWAGAVVSLARRLRREARK